MYGLKYHLILMLDLIFETVGRPSRAECSSLLKETLKIVVTRKAQGSSTRLSHVHCAD